MDARPSFLGRGRGRAQRGQNKDTSSFSSVPRSRKPGKAPSAWSSGPPTPTVQQKNSQQNDHVKPTSMGNDRQRKVDEIRQAAAKFTSEETYLESSDSDEEVNDDEILDNTLKTYRGL